MSRPIIQIEGLGKEYRIGALQSNHDRLGEQLLDLFIAPWRRTARLLSGRSQSAADLQDSIWALRDVSFDVHQGDVVGVIGPNGAGKTTLLKILSRITEPTKGYARVRGRLGALLEVGTGFHPELTGRENVFLNGAILGMDRKEIERKFDEIVDFAEIDRFIDTPVKYYSSGMYVRLAFGVAANLEPDILLVDEVLAVGDAAFQKKSLGKMSAVASEGRTVLFVSHNLGLVRSLCTRGVLIRNGGVEVDGTVEEAVDTYLKTLDRAQSIDLKDRQDRQGAGLVRVEKVEISVDGDLESAALQTGGAARFVFHLSGTLPGMSCLFVIHNAFGDPISLLTSENPIETDHFDPDMGATYICDIDELLLVEGSYRINVLIRGGGRDQDFIEGAASFDVYGGELRGRPTGPNLRKNINVAMPHQWTMPPLIK